MNRRFSSALKPQTYLVGKKRAKLYPSPKPSWQMVLSHSVLTLSFSTLINTDGLPDSSGGQNLKQDRSLSPCYHLNGFR